MLHPIGAQVLFHSPVDAGGAEVRTAHVAGGRPAGADGSLTGHSAALGLNLCWQPPKLRLYDPASGAWLQDPDDLRQASRAAEARADAEAAARRAAEAELAALRQRIGHPPPA